MHYKAQQEIWLVPTSAISPGDMIPTQHSCHTQLLLILPIIFVYCDPQQETILHHGPVYMSNMLCLYMMVSVGMHKTENRFWIRTQVIYSDDFYPILFYILKHQWQPTKLFLIHNRPMTLQLEKHQLFDSRSYLYIVPFSWTTPSPSFTHFNLSSKITSLKKPSSWTTITP